MKKSEASSLGTIAIILFLLWCVVELVREYWYALILVIICGLVYLFCTTDKSKVARGNRKDGEDFTYIENETPPQLPPMPYVASEIDTGEDNYLARRGVGEVYDAYYRLSEVIQRSKSISQKLAACEETYEILPEFVRVNLRDFGSLPDTILCRDVGIELYLRLGRWEEASTAIEKCAAAGVYDDDGAEMFDYFNRYKRTAELALDFLNANAGFLQKNMYRALPDADQECLKKFTRSSMQIRKEKSGSTNKLYVA